MEFDLQQRLHDLNRAQVVAPEPVPVGQVLTRVRRGRAIRTVAVGLASAAVVIGAAAVVYAAPWNPPPPAETPTPAPTIEPTPEPTPGPTPTPEPLFDVTTMDNLFLPVEALSGVAPALGDLEDTWDLSEWADIPEGAEFLPELRCKPAKTIVDEAPAEYAHRGQGAFSQEIVLLADQEAATDAFTDLTDALETCGGWGVDLVGTHGAWWAIDETTRGAEGFRSIRVTGSTQDEGHDTPWIEVDALIGNAILRIGAVYTDTSPVSATADAAALEAAVQNHLAAVAAGPLLRRVDPPIVALTTTGDLVLLDPETGETLDVIASDEALRGPISLTPDRSAAYLTRGEGWPRQVVRVSLADGSMTTIADGTSPSLSPDGRTLAYVAQYNINHPDDPEWRSLALLDLPTGDVQYLPDNSCGGCARRIDQPAWSPDGSRLYVAVGFEDSAVPSMDLVVVLPGTTTELDTATLFQPNDSYSHGEPGFPAFLADGRLAVVSVINYGTGDASDGLSAHYGTIETFNAGTATLIGSEQFAELHSVAPGDDLMTHSSGVAASGASNTLAIVAQDWAAGAGPRHLLYLWDGGTELRLIAQDVVAVAW